MKAPVSNVKPNEDHRLSHRLSSSQSIPLRPRSGINYRTEAAPRELSLKEMFGFLRRNSPIIAASVLFFLAIGVAYILLSAPKFTATARLVIDPNGARVFAASSTSENIPDASAVESQIEIIKSDVIAAVVIHKLKLTQDPEFITPKPAVLEQIRWLAPALFDRIFGPSGKQLTSVNHNLNIAITNFARDLQVSRVGSSYVAEINFTSVDPKKAASIANAVADAYIDYQLDSRIYNAQRANAWIRQRLVELHQNSQKASDALGKFKATAPALVKDGKLSVEQSNIQIQELKSTAESYKNIYETFRTLSRFVQSVQEQSFPITQARIISKAERPLTKSQPKTRLTLLASLALGLVVGTGSAFARGLLDTRIRTQNQLERDLGTICLGIIPPVKRHHRFMSDAARALRHRGIAPLLDDCHSSAGAGEVLRALRSAIDAVMPSGRCHVIGITSAFHGEGRTTLSANLATVLHEANRRVLLVDGDSRNHRISDGIAAERGNGISHAIDEGLFSVLSGSAKLADVIFPGPFGWCLPVETTNAQVKHPTDFWSSSGAAKLFASIKKQYDYVIIDLPPLLSHVDAEAVATHSDAIIIVAKYGTTKVDELDRALNESKNIPGRLFGVLVNRMPTIKRPPRLKTRFIERSKRVENSEFEHPRTAVTKNESDAERAASLAQEPFEKPAETEISSI